jgi:CTP synthase (UTP-ammonia lyase)
VCRSTELLSESTKRKISNFCHVTTGMMIRMMRMMMMMTMIRIMMMMMMMMNVRVMMMMKVINIMIRIIAGISTILIHHLSSSQSLSTITDQIIAVHNVSNIYHVPLILFNQGNS